MTGDEPMLTPEEEAELIERINANPNLHPLPPVGKDADLIERLRATKTERRMLSTFGGAVMLPDDETREVLVNPDGPEAAARLSVMEEALRLIADETSWRGFSPMPQVERMREHARAALAKLEQQE